MTRCIAVKWSKELKAFKNKTESDLLSRIGFLLSKAILSSEEELEVREIKNRSDLYWVSQEGVCEIWSQLARRGGNKFQLFFPFGEKKWSKEITKYA